MAPPPRAPLAEKGWIIEINAIPGMSGSPVLLRNRQMFIDDQDHLQAVIVPPLIIGVLKGTLSTQLGPTGLGVIEPYQSIAKLLENIYADLRAQKVPFVQ